MCGIAGFVEKPGRKKRLDFEAIITDMTDAIQHRGPDDSGAWFDPAEGVALGFRRLAIIDLTPSGHQPMVSEDGRFVIVFNGEIYNFESLRRQLQDLGNSFRGTSDTEVMLAAFCQYGLEEAVKKFNGMFAFALWDRRDRQFHLVRDRLGIKPLYYGWMGESFLFGSEIKALRANPAFMGEIDRNALALYVRHNYIPAPYTIYRGLSKLMPGTILTLSERRDAASTVTRTYWSARQVVERGCAHPFDGSEQEAVEELDRLLRESVRLRMVADVPLGAFLSGGVDSSTIVALMQTQSSLPVRTFTIGFREQEYNEAFYAREVARHLGTSHTELTVTPQEAQAVIPRLATLYDEPFSDSSQIPTFLVSELTRRHVTVSLSGDGGDELFAGYNRYFWGRSIWRRVGWAPVEIRGLAAAALRWFSPQRWDRLFQQNAGLLPEDARVPTPGDKVHKLAEVLAVESPQALYTRLVSLWKEPLDVVPGALEPPTPLTDPKQWPQMPDFTRWMMYMDLVTYLPDDILAKVDRASMGVSLEARVPFLDDHRVVEFAWTLPLEMKIRGGRGKHILREVLHRYVPRELIERPKMGFGVPIDAWLRGPLRDWAEGLLGEKRLLLEGYFNPAPIRQKWQEHLSGSRNWQYYLWDILMFQEWLEKT